MTASLIFIILALIAFLVGTANPGWPPANLVSLGLAFLTVAWLLRGNLG